MQSTRNLFKNCILKKSLYLGTNLSQFKPNYLRLKIDSKNFQNRNFNNRASNQQNHFYVPKTSLILKSGLFTVAFAGTCYSVAVISNYERVKQKKKSFSLHANEKFSEFRQQMNQYWNGLTDVKKAVTVIVFLNLIVFFGWRIPALQNTLHKYFLLSPISGVYSQMIFSVFSHQQLFHIVFNMVALYSMSDLISRILPMEQFIAYYLSSGVFASFASSLAKLLRSTPNSFSLGASGAIVSCFAISSLIFPNSKFYVFPIPFEIEAQTLLKGLVAFDLAFLLMGSRRMDHAAHLGGALYGLIFFTWGPNLINNLQSYVIKKWKSIRESKN